jgi:class 3 adenylate cyclase
VAVEVPPIRYAVSGDVHVAYQTWGDGPAFVGVPPFVQNIELLWSDPTDLYPAFLRNLGSCLTMTHFDKRGTGLSDRVPGFAGLEQRMEDFHAVMDHAGIDRAFIGGISEGGPLAMLFAATYPERVEGLMLCGSAARFVQGDGYPHGATPELFGTVIDALVGNWATADSILAPVWMPSIAGDPEFRRWLPTYERACASPGAVREILQFVRDIDVRDVLPSIRVPTIVIHRTGDLVAPIDHGRYLAEHIPNCELVELPGSDHTPWTGENADEIVDTIIRFALGRPAVRATPVDRMLATVLFTDIVGSTTLATALGDRDWHQLLDRHDRIARGAVEREGGRVVKTTGDGVLATFDSPSGAVRATLALAPAMRDIGIEIRAGLHTGEVERRGDDIAGVAVHVAARVEALAGAGQVLTTSTVRDLVLGSPFTFDEHGMHALKGVPGGEWRILSVSG